MPYAEVARLVMSAMAARQLRDDEEVRHISGDLTDCRPENLEMWCNGQRFGQPATWQYRHELWVLKRPRRAVARLRA
jgi:hypothetical protein